MAQGKAKRLVLEAGQWTLEVEQLMAQGGQLYRPHPRPIQGSDAILSWLKNNQPVLLQAAAHFFSKQHADGECLAYRAEAKGWSSTSFAPALKAGHGDSSGISDAAASELAEIKQHVFLLESRLETVHKLESRIARLERMLQSGHVSQAAPVSSAVPAASPSLSANNKEPDAPKSQKPVPQKPVEQKPLPQDPAPEPENEVTLANAERPELDLPAPDPATTAPAREDRLDAPTTTAMQETIAALLGAEMEMSEDLKLPLPSFADLTGPCYICQILDDAGEIEGLILTDLEATVRLGGSLMMTPADEIANQIVNAEPSEDVVDAAAEIFNNLSGVLNNVEGNKHIKVDTARPLVESEHPWLAEPYVRHDFKFAEGGRLSYLFI